MEAVTVTDLLSLHLKAERGEKRGVCVFCGREREGHAVKFPDTFITFDRVTHGDIICNSCWVAFKNADVRRNSWVVSREELRFLKRNEILDVIESPPDPPWALYVTRSRRKHGWLYIIDRVNYSRDRFYVGFDETPIFVVRDEFLRLVNLVRQLRERKIPTSEIFSGRFSPRSALKADRELLEEVKAYAGSPLLGLALFIA